MVSAHPLCQEGVALSFSGPGNCREQRLFLPHQQHPLPGAGDGGVEKIPGQQDPVGRRHGNDHGVMLAAHGFMDGHGVRQLQLLQFLQGVFRVPAVEIHRNDTTADLTQRSDLAVEHALGKLFSPTVEQEHIVVVLRLHHPVVETEQLAAVCEIRFVRFCGIDLVPEGLVQVLRGRRAVGADVNTWTRFIPMCSTSCS